jgi:hypothetical protein
MKIITKGISDPFNQNNVDVRATGEVEVKQDSDLKIRVENNNSEIGITDNRFCAVVGDDKSITQIIFRNGKEVVFSAYYKDENGNLHKKDEEPYAIVNIIDQEIKEQFPLDR